MKNLDRIEAKSALICFRLGLPCVRILQNVSAIFTSNLKNFHNYKIQDFTRIFPKNSLKIGS